MYKELKPKFVSASTVNQAAVWVSTGNVDAATLFVPTYIDFKDKLKILYVFPRESHRPVLFWIASVNQNGRKFEKFFLKDVGSILKTFGFKPIEDKNVHPK